MTSVPLTPAVTVLPPGEPDAAASSVSADGGLFGGLVAEFGSASSSLEKARQAEEAFAAGRGGLQEMVFERARADAVLSVAGAGASKAAQALNTIVNMQV
jgi:flagellar hook-basal body complex protein FliE